jgi:hypothetical protein
MPPTKLTETQPEHKERNATLQHVSEAFRKWITTKKNRTTKRPIPFTFDSRNQKLHESLENGFNNILVDWKDITE